MDELFKTMIERRAFNPVDMILQFRRVVDYLSKLPATLNVAQVARYVAAEAMMSILVLLPRLQHPTSQLTPC